MRRELFQHKLAYLILLLGVIGFVFYFFAVWPNRLQQRLAIGGFSGFYFLWGVITHVNSRNLNRRVVIEYGAVALLVSVLLMLVTL